MQALGIQPIHTPWRPLRTNGVPWIIRAQRTDRREPKVVTTGVVDLPQRVSFTPGDTTEELSFGVAAAQGPRDTMEDEAVVFPEGKCGFLYASEI